MPEITPAILAAADQVDSDLDALDMSTRTLLSLLRAGDTQPPSGGGGGDAGFVTSFEGSAASGTTVTVTLTDVAAGDLLLGFFAASTAGGALAPNAPTDWTLIDRYSAATGNFKAGAYYRVADAAVASVTFTLPFSGTNLKAQVRQYRPGSGVSYDASPVDVFASTKAASGTATMQAPAITTTVDNALVTYFWADNKNTTHTLPTLDDRVDQISVNSDIITGDSLVATAGAAPQPTVTVSPNVDVRMISSIAIKPPA